MDLLKQLKKIIPIKLHTFERLNRSKKPCEFLEWHKSESSFYYRFNANKKKVCVNELQNLIRLLKEKKIVNRKNFEDYCEYTNKSGGCGFAVMVRIIEYLKIGKYQGHGKGVILININK